MIFMANREGFFFSTPDYKDFRLEYPLSSINMMNLCYFLPNFPFIRTPPLRSFLL